MDPLAYPPAVAAFLDCDGRICRMPAKLHKQLLVLDYLSEKFQRGQDYTEKEVNALCALWSTTGDIERLRRGLIDARLLCRERDGSRYWRPEVPHGAL